MNVKELKAELNKFPDTMNVFVAERKTEFTYGMVNSIATKEITFGDWADPDFGETKDTVLVLDEE